MQYQDIITFAQAHSTEDPLRLILQQKRYPQIDLSLVAQQIEGQRQAQTKWPTLAACTDYFYPPKLNREQSSSEATARYKADLFKQLQCSTFADLTGGMGIDTYFIAQHASQAEYFELNSALFPVTQHNFSALGLPNIVCHNTDSIQYLADSQSTFDLILIDPARRNSTGSRVVAFEDCTPNLLNNLDLLCSRCRHLLVKASPMIDIRQAVQQLNQVSEIHIISVGGECKEVLFLLSKETTGNTQIHCVNLATADPTITFTSAQENDASPIFATAMSPYIYEPNASLMKGGCYNLLSQQYNIAKLARNTHLYTADQLIEDFPGRKFRTIQEVALNAKEIKKIIPEGRAHVVTRNYPLAAADLQKKLKLKEGGNLFIIAATLASRPMGWLCEKC